MGMAWYMVWPGEFWHGIWYCLSGIACHMVWPGEIWHGIWYRLAGMAWYMVWPGEVWHGILYGLADMSWYMIRPGEVCGNDYVNFMFYGIVLGYGSVHTWRSRCQLEVHTYRIHSQVEGPLQSMFRSHVQLLFILGSGSKLRECEYIYHYSGSHSNCLLRVDQDFLWKLILVLFNSV